MNKQVIKEVFTGLVLSLLLFFQYQINETNEMQFKAVSYSNYNLDSLKRINKENRKALFKQDSLINRLQNNLIDLSDDTIDSLDAKKLDDLRSLADSEL
jgi:hypothetical protein